MGAYTDQPRTYNAGVTALVPRAFVYFYEVGTDDPKGAYAQATLRAPLNLIDVATIEYAVPLPNPLQANEAARLPAIFLDGEYRILITDEDGNELHDLDPFTAWPAPAVLTPLSDDGEILPFATLTFYRNNTTMLQSIGQANPVVADVNGEFPSITVTDETGYRVVLHDGDGRLIYDVQPFFTIGVEEMPQAFSVINSNSLQDPYHIDSVTVISEFGQPRYLFDVTSAGFSSSDSIVAACSDYNSAPHTFNLVTFSETSLAIDVRDAAGASVESNFCVLFTGK